MTRAQRVTRTQYYKDSNKIIMIKKIYIDLSKIITPHELFQEFSHIFSFPSYFGNNWDALFDMMNSLDPGSDIF